MAFQCFQKRQGNSDDDYKILSSSSPSSSSSSGFGPLILRYDCGSGFQRFFGSGYLRISIIDGKSEKECNLSGLKSLRHANFVGCCNGLALLTLGPHSDQHIVVNPLSNEIMPPIQGPYRGGDLCGLFFHPLAKEYRILSVRKLEYWRRLVDEEYVYQLYLFGSKKWRKIASPYFKYGHKVVCGTPVITNDALHWDCEDQFGIGFIMVFDMISEELSVRQYPFKVEKEKYLARRLSVNEDGLCFCFLGREESLMDVWVMQDYANWSWTKKYVVDLEWDINMYPMESGFRFKTLWDIMGYITIVGIQNEELVLLWKHRGMFSYHLGSNTVKQIHLNKSTMDTSGRLSGFEVYSPNCVICD